MKGKIFLIVICILLASNIAFVDDAHCHSSSKTSLDWEGKYIGVLTSDDLVDLHVQIDLFKDWTFDIFYRKEDCENIVYITGKFRWDESGNSIKLEANHFPAHFKVGEVYLLQLDKNGIVMSKPDCDKNKLKKV